MIVTVCLLLYGYEEHPLVHQAVRVLAKSVRLLVGTTVEELVKVATRSLVEDQ